MGRISGRGYIDMNDAMTKPIDADRIRLALALLDRHEALAEDLAFAKGDRNIAMNAVVLYLSDTILSVDDVAPIAAIMTEVGESSLRADGTKGGASKPLPEIIAMSWLAAAVTVLKDRAKVPVGTGVRQV